MEQLHVSTHFLALISLPLGGNMVIVCSIRGLGPVWLLLALGVGEKVILVLNIEKGI